MQVSEYPIEDLNVAAAYQAIPDTSRHKLLAIRHLIFEISAQSDTIGTIEETLKWGVPSYLTSRPKSGTTVRLQYNPAAEKYGIFVHCQTSLIPDFKLQFPKELAYEKSRGITFDKDTDFPKELIEEFLGRALSYHSSKK